MLLTRLCVFVILGFYLLTGCAQSNEQDHIYNTLQGIDNGMTINPHKALDSLNKIEYQHFNRGNLYYYYLLRSIGRERCHIEDKEDSLLLLSEEWYKDKNDHRNLIRCILYKGIIRYNSYKLDSLAQQNIYEAKSIYDKYHIYDPATETILYKYLGKIKRIKNQLNEAEKDLNHGLQICTRIKDSNETQQIRYELFYTTLSQKKFSLALSYIQPYINNNTTNLVEIYEKNEALYYYFTAKQEYNRANHFLKELSKIPKYSEFNMIDMSSIYYRISLNFKHLGFIDSAIYYCIRAVESVDSTNSPSVHAYYKFLAELSSTKGDMSTAYAYYKKAYNSYIKSFSRITSNQALAINTKYNQSEQKLIQVREKNHLYLIIIIFVAFFSAVILLNSKLRKYKNKNSNLINKSIVIEEEFNKLKFVNEINVVSLGLLNQLIQNLAKEAERNRIKASDIAERLDDFVSQTKRMSKLKFSEIVKNNLITNDPRISQINSLTDFERIIFVLLENGYKVKEIALMLDRTPSCISGEKNRIKEKILKHTELKFDPKTSFAIFK